MNTHTTPKLGQHAIVIGGSMAGLLTARVLSDHFAQVTILERDPVQDAPEARKGQPQTRHLHGLLAKGLETMSHYFPDLIEGLRNGGAIIGDMGETMRWYANGGYRIQYPSGLYGALMSRPFLEWQIRRRVLALANVTLWGEVDVEGLLTSEDRRHVCGVQITRRNQVNGAEQLSADLVIDASGRGSASPKWLEALGYARPAERAVKVNVGYATRIFRRKPGDLVGAELVMVAAEAPHNKRTGLVFPIEGDRWICTLAGQAGDHAPADEQGFMAFARSLAAPDVYHLIRHAEPLSDIMLHKLPSSLRRHYEQLKHFPEGYLVLGDAVCSFNPVYGQGMTSAALQAAELDKLLVKRQRTGSLEGLWQPFFRRAAKVIDIPWQLAVGEDFRFAETEGEKAPGTDLINSYVNKVYQAMHHDTVVYGEFLKVMNLMQPPTALFHPKVLWRVLWGKRPVTAPAAAQPLPVAGD
jgi:2-polyprenyl-6-methoxyphenol hydroxylase-like FAD-dependent oxidoreductase